MSRRRKRRPEDPPAAESGAPEPPPEPAAQGAKDVREEAPPAKSAAEAARGKDARAKHDAGPGEPTERAPRRPLAERVRAKLIQSAIVLGFAFAAFGTGLFVFNYLLMPGLIHSKSEIKVPNVHQLSLDQAETVLGQHGLQVSRAGERFDPEVPRGFVISQDPLPGAPVRRQKTVQVIVSLGEEFSSVPALFGESRRSAEQLLKSAGLVPGRITRALSRDVGEGLVLASDPPAESVLARDTPVSLLVSAGGGDDTFLMPDLRGREIGRARAQLEAFGLLVRVPGVSAPIGVIVYQRPRPGAQISARDTVVLQAMGRLIQ